MGLGLELGEERWRRKDGEGDQFKAEAVFLLLRLFQGQISSSVASGLVSRSMRPSGKHQPQTKAKQ